MKLFISSKDFMDDYEYELKMYGRLLSDYVHEEMRYLQAIANKEPKCILRVRRNIYERTKSEYKKHEENMIEMSLMNTVQRLIYKKK